MPNIQQGIQDFYRVAQERDFARDFQFRVLDISDRGAPVLTQDDLVYATAANLPARGIQNVPTPFMGLQFNLPGAVEYPDATGYQITFRADGDNAIRTVFENWSRSIFDDETSTGAYRLYANSTVSLAQLNANLDVVRVYQLVGAWPITVGELVYNTTGNGEVVEFQATLAYQYWRRNILPV